MLAVAGLLPAAAVLAGRRLDEEHPGPVHHLRPVVLATSRSCSRTSGTRSRHDDGIFVHWLLNTVVYAVVSALGAALLAAAAGYGFAKYRFRGNGAGFNLVLGAVMVPTTALAIPTYLLFAQGGPGQHAVGGHPAVAGQPLRPLPHADLRPGRRPGQPHRGRPDRRRRRSPDLLPHRVAAAGARPGHRGALHARGDLEQLLPAADHAQRPERLYPVTVGLASWAAQAQNGGAGASSDMLAARA